MAYLVYGYNRLNADNWISNHLFSKYTNSVLNIFREEDVFEDYFTDYGVVIDFDDFAKKYSDIHCNISKNLLEDNSSEIFATYINYHVFIHATHTMAIDGLDETTLKVRDTATKYDFKFTDNTLVYKKNTKLPKSEKEDLKKYISSIFNFNYYGVRPLFFPAERSSIHLFSKEIFKQKAAQRDELAKVIQNGNDIENAIKTFQLLMIICHSHLILNTLQNNPKQILKI